MRRRIVTIVLLGALGVLAAGSLARASRQALTSSADLARRAEEVALFVARIDPYGDPDMTYPPTAPPVFTPLVAPFGPTTLRIVWLGLNVLALAGLGAAVVEGFVSGWPARLQVAFWLVATASRATRGGIGLGQFHLIPTTCLLLAVPAARAGREVTAGLLVTLSLVKPSMGLPLLAWFALRRRWTTLIVAGAGQGALVLLTSAWVRVAPLQLVREWLERARGQEAAGTLDVPSLMRRILSEGSGDTGLWSLGVLALGIGFLYRFRDRSDLGLTSLGLFVAALFTYHRHYDLVLLLPTLAYLFDLAHRTRGHVRVVLIGAAVAVAATLMVPIDPSISGSARGRDWLDLGLVGSAYTTFLGLIGLLCIEARLIAHGPGDPVSGLGATKNPGCGRHPGPE